MKPHFEAVLTIRMTLPLKEGRLKGLPVSIFARRKVISYGLAASVVT